MPRFTSSLRSGAFTLLKRSSRLRFIRSDIDRTPSATSGHDRYPRLAADFRFDAASSAYSLACRTRREDELPGNAREMIATAERRFPVRIRIGVPRGGPGRRHAQMTAWLDENWGADGWAMRPSGTRGVLTTLANAFVARWCVRAKVEPIGGVFQVREDEPVPRLGATSHRMP